MRRHPVGTRCSTSLENLEAQGRIFSLQRTKMVNLKRLGKEIMMAL